MFKLGGKSSGRRSRSRPQLESLEDRLPPNNLSALGALIGGPDESGAIVRAEIPQAQSQPSPASVNATMRQGAAPVLTTVPPSRSTTPGQAAPGPVDFSADQTAASSTAWATGTGTGLIDLSSLVGPSDAPMPVRVPQATPARGGVALATAAGGGAVVLSVRTLSVAAPPSSPSAASTTLPIAVLGGSGASNATPIQRAASAPSAVTPAVSQVTGSIPGVAGYVNLAGTTTLTTPPAGVAGTVNAPDSLKDPGRDASGAAGKQSPPAGTVPTVASASVAAQNPELLQSFDGLNAYNQRYDANNGNQFQVVPPDQGLAVGNGKVLEVVNTVLRVYDTSGNALTGVKDLNTFFGYAAQIDRTTGVVGPALTDPSAYFDQPTQRWFVDVLTYNDPNFDGDHIDIAVSQTADPTGAWNIYKTPVQNSGDYPHIGADRNGIYITENEFDSNTGNFIASQVYAFSKAALASGASSVPMVHFDTVNANLDGYPGFTLIPSLTPGDAYAGGNRGTEYFLSSSGAVLYNATGSASVLGLWSMTNTESLNNPTPSPSLTYSVLNVNSYSQPPLANQKVGPYPYGQSLGAPESALESLDTRMTQVTYASGKLWGALDTAVNVGGQVKAGIEWFVILPNVSGSGHVVNQGVLALANNNLIFPAIAVAQNGEGVMGFSLAGDDYFPSAGYATIDARSGVGDIHVAASGAGPEDEFASYLLNDPRFGDYGAAVADGDTIWVGNEYIANTGTLAEYMADPTLGHTRAILTNWDTRISQVKT
jgi:hypothetical protein